jgi:hypothetical protein
LKEIVGLEAYRAAELRMKEIQPIDLLKPKPRLGTLEEILNSRLMAMKKQVEFITTKQKDLELWMN